MKQQNDNTNNILLFLEGKMNEQEKKAFDQQLRTDQDLVDQMAFIIATKRVIKNNFTDADKKRLIEEVKRQKRKLKVIRNTSIAATAAIILLIFYLVPKFFVDQEQKELLSNTVNSNVKYLRAAGGATWEQDILQKKYKEALTKLNQEYEARKTSEPCSNEDLQFWQGLILAGHSSKYSEAIPKLKCAVEKNFEIKSSVTWLIYAYVKTDQNQAAEELLLAHPEVKPALPENLQKKLKKVLKRRF